MTNTNDDGPGSLRQAITDADGTTGADTITISAQGTLTLATALPDLPDGVTITGPGATKFTVDGNGANRIFLLLGSRTAAISGLTATNGLASSATPGGDPNGGAIESKGTLTLDHVTVSGSSSDGGNGGGIATESSSTLTLSTSTVTGNTATVGSGGGVYALGTVTIRDSTVSNNTAEGSFSFGGGIEVGSTPSTFSSGASGSLNMAGSTVSGNKVLAGKETGGVGGGIDEQVGSTMAIAQSTISGNMAQFTAGGMRVGGDATVTESTISSNTALNFAGGIGVSSMFEFQPGNLTLRNSTVTGNSSSGTGGGIGNFNKTTLVSDTVASNSAVEGGANIANDIDNNQTGGR